MIVHSRFCVVCFLSPARLLLYPECRYSVRCYYVWMDDLETRTDGSHEDCCGLHVAVAESLRSTRLVVIVIGWLKRFQLCGRSCQLLVGGECGRGAGEEDVTRARPPDVSRSRLAATGPAICTRSETAARTWRKTCGVCVVRHHRGRVHRRREEALSPPGRKILLTLVLVHACAALNWRSISTNEANPARI